MYLQIVRFCLSAEHVRAFPARCSRLAAAVGQEPGLLGLVWLGDPDTNLRGLAAMWTDSGALTRFLHGDLFRAITEGAAAVINIEAFSLLDGPSRVTLGAFAPSRWNHIGAPGAPDPPERRAPA